MDFLATDVDCCVLEGGGQMFRNCLALAALEQRSVRLFNIRHNRPKPGLSNQHLVVAQLINSLTGGVVIGAELQSTVLKYRPGIITSKCSSTITVDVGSAGAISLLSQAVLPCLLFLDTVTGQMKGDCSSDSIQLIFSGGTNVPFSPPIDHVQHVLLPILKQMGLQARLDIERRGFYPIGGGRVNLSIHQPVSSIYAIDLTTPGVVIGVAGVVCGSGILFTDELSEAFQAAFTAAITLFLEERRLLSALKNVIAEGIFQNSSGSGTSSSHGKKRQSRPQKHWSFAAQVWLTTDNGIPISANVLYNGKQADGFDMDTAIKSLMAQLTWVVDHGACVDEYTADQLIVYMAILATRAVSQVSHNNSNKSSNSSHSCKATSATALTTSARAANDTGSNAVAGLVPCRILCAPKVLSTTQTTKTTGEGTSSIPAGGNVASTGSSGRDRKVGIESGMGTAPPAGASSIQHSAAAEVKQYLSASSLHIEGAIHIASTMTGCQFTIEEQPHTGNRLISTHASINS